MDFLWRSDFFVGQKKNFQDMKKLFLINNFWSNYDWFIYRKRVYVNVYDVYFFILVSVRLNQVI